MNLNQLELLYLEWRSSDEIHIRKTITFEWIEVKSTNTSNLLQKYSGNLHLIFPNTHKTEVLEKSVVYRLYK